MGKYKSTISVTIEKTRTGFSAYTDDRSIYTTGRDIPSLYENLIEAMSLAEGIDVFDAGRLRLKMDLRQFFRYYKVLNANFLAERIGMNPTLLSQYVTGRKQPSPRQTEKILKGVQAIGKELAAISLHQR